MARLRGGRPTAVTLLGGAVRLVAGVPLAWWLWTAATAPDMPAAAVAAGTAVAAATVWRPAAGLLIVAALTPAAALLAPPPVRAAELLAWSLLAPWLLCVWRPLAGRPSSPSTPPAIALPALLYAAALAASWLALTIAGAPGVPALALPWFVLHSVPSDHLVRSSPEPETWMMLQSLTGIALLLASLAMVRDDPRLRRRVAWTFVASLTVLAVVTLVEVANQWAAQGYAGWFLMRYVHGERISVHLRDLNAAGSLYVLAGITAAAVALFEPRRRGLWEPALVPILPALGLTGSRTSIFAAVGGLLLLVVAQRRWRLTGRQIGVVIALVGLCIVLGLAAFDWRPDVRGSAGRAVSLRSQFLETTARMFASAPVFGVGVGRYFDRSAAFMPDTLRELYGNENAHNYFAQQFAELGLVGGLVFVWLVWTVLAAGWAAARTQADGPPALSLGLFAGVGAYLLTCLTGHPILVPEAAFPFWIAAGALVATVGAPARTSRHVVAAAIVGVLVVSGVARAAATYAGVTEVPPDHGFHGAETAPDGTTFRWMTRHAVTYVPPGPGFVRLRLQAPQDLTWTGPLIVQISWAGRTVDRRELPPHGWVTYDLPAAVPVDAPFRRIDLRTNQQWMQDTQLGQRAAQRPVAVMAAEIRWIPLEEIGRP